MILSMEKYESTILKKCQHPIKKFWSPFLYLKKKIVYHQFFQWLFILITFITLFIFLWESAWHKYLNNTITTFSVKSPPGMDRLIIFLILFRFYGFHDDVLGSLQQFPKTDIKYWTITYQLRLWNIRRVESN